MRRAVAGVLLSLLVCAYALASAATAAPTTTTRPQPATSGLPSASEGFPWVLIGVIALAAGLIGWRLRMAARG